MLKKIYDEKGHLNRYCLIEELLNRIEELRNNDVDDVSFDFGNIEVSIDFKSCKTIIFEER